MRDRVFRACCLRGAISAGMEDPVASVRRFCAVLFIGFGGTDSKIRTRRF